MEKASKASSITKYDDVIEAVGNNMKTNFTFDDIKSLIYYVTSRENIDIESLQLKGTDQNDGVYYYQLDEESVQEVADTLQNHLESSGE